MKVDDARTRRFLAEKDVYEAPPAERVAIAGVVEQFHGRSATL